MRENKKLILITGIVNLLPMLIGLILWNRLPEQMPTHWNGAGEIDGYHSRQFAVFFIPLFILAMHLLCAAATMNDPRKRNMSPKIIRLVLWICPAVSLFVSVLIYPSVLGYTIDANLVVGILMGILFIIAGNYLPKCRQNYTIGIKVPWTLSDEDNWNRTHRLAGPIWVIGGFIILLYSFLRYRQAQVMVLTAVIMVLVPVLYSFFCYVKKNKEL